MKQCLLLFLLVSCTVAYSQNRRQPAPDPWAGTWKLDLTKSKLHPPAPKEETVTVDSITTKLIKYTIKGTDAQGKDYTVTYSGKPGAASPEMVDGKEMSKVTYHLPAPHELNAVSRGSDGSTSNIKIILSKDAKTTTLHEHRKDAKGVHDQTAVYVRQ
jgi:hypothetical protein